MFQTNVVEKVKTHIFCSMTLYENKSVYEIMWKNNVERWRPQMTIWRMHIACWMPKATNKHRMSNTHCISTAKMFARTHLNVTLYVYCCLVWIYSSQGTLNYFSVSLRKTSVHTHTTLQAHHWVMESFNDKKKSWWTQWSMHFLNLHCLFPKKTFAFLRLYGSCIWLMVAWPKFLMRTQKRELLFLACVIFRSQAFITNVVLTTRLYLSSRKVC